MTWGSPWDVSLIFSPGQRHEIEEKQQRAMLREDEGVEGDPPSRVDLDAGVAVIRLGAPDDPEADSVEPPGAQAAVDPVEPEADPAP